MDLLSDEDLKQLLEKLGWLLDQAWLAYVRVLQVDASKFSHRERVLKNATIAFLMELEPHR